MVSNFAILPKYFQPVCLKTFSSNFYLSALNAHMLQPGLTARAISGKTQKSDPLLRALRLCNSTLLDSVTHDELGVLKHGMVCGRFAKDCLDSSLYARKMAKRKKKQDTLIDVEKTQLKSRLNFL